MNCDGCTLCCKLIDVPWMDSPPGNQCKECIPGVGCKLWDTCPDNCKAYECSYRQVDRCSIELRPDNIKMIFEKISDRIFLGINDPDYKITKKAKLQIMSFVKQGFSVVVSNYKEKNPKLFLAKDHNANQIIEEVKKIKASL